MMDKSERPYLLALAPVVCLAHIAEEAPGLIAWLNRRVEPDLSVREFVAINTFGVLITVALAGSSVRSRSFPLALGLIAWLSFLMLANGALHLTASLLLREYVPGTVTAGVLYLPYFFAATATICHTSSVRTRTAVLAAALGALPMLAQGIGILAFGRRLLW